MIDPVASSVAALRPLRSPETVGLVPDAVGEAAGASIGRTPASGSFSDMVTGLVRAVDAKDKTANAEVKSLLLGESDNIHRSMIAMQESGLAFSLLVEVRNKLVESYQELMRMPV